MAAQIPRSRSNWANVSARVIVGVLDGLPPAASLEEKKRAIRAAYPFGERRYTPYKQWCKTVRAMLLITPKKRTHRVRVELQEGRCWLDMNCDWCMATKGCIFCTEARYRLAPVVANPGYLSLAINVRKGECPIGILRDWLEENGVAWEDVK